MKKLKVFFNCQPKFLLRNNDLKADLWLVPLFSENYMTTKKIDFLHTWIFACFVICLKKGTL